MFKQFGLKLTNLRLNNDIYYFTLDTINSVYKEINIDDILNDIKCINYVYLSDTSDDNKNDTEYNDDNSKLISKFLCANYMHYNGNSIKVDITHLIIDFPRFKKSSVLYDIHTKKLNGLHIHNATKDIKFKNVDEIHIYNSTIKNIDFNVKKLFIYKCEIDKNIDLSNFKINILSIQSSKLETIKLPKDIELLYLYNNNISVIDVNVDSLKVCGLSRNKFSEFPKFHKNIVNIFMNENNLETVNVSELDSLMFINLSDNKLRSIYISDKLKTLSINNTLIYKLNYETIKNLNVLGYDNVVYTNDKLEMLKNLVMSN